MLLKVHTERKLVEVWLTKDETRDNALQENLKPYFSEYTAKKYLVVVYESGIEDLLENMKGLLQHQHESG